MKSLIRVELARQNMSQRELAERIGIAPNTLSRWVNNELPKAQFGHVAAIARELKCSVEDLYEAD